MFAASPSSKLFTGLLLAGLVAGRAWGESAKVDVALVLAGDVSGSMSAGELQVQREGIAATFLHPGVLSIIGSGAYGKVAVTYVEWAGPAEQWVTVPWTIISDRASAGAFAAALAAAPKAAGNSTSMSMALLFAAAQFNTSPADALRRTIDISGDGPNSAGPPIADARDFVLKMGITINGLTFAESAGSDSGPYAYLTEAEDVDLDRYYEDCVIGGAGGFAMSTDSPGGFTAAIRRKVSLEIAGLPARVEHADFSPRREKSVDCVAVR